MGRGKVVRRDANWWSPLNQAYRQFIESNGHKPDRAWLEGWFEKHGDETWPNGDRPTIQHAWDHCKCLRTLDQARDYFRAYRARKKDEKDRDDTRPGGGRKRSSHDSDQQHMGDSWRSAGGGGVGLMGDLSSLAALGGRASAMDPTLPLLMTDLNSVRSTSMPGMGLFPNLGERLSGLGAVSPGAGGAASTRLLSLGTNGEWAVPPAVDAADALPAAENATMPRGEASDDASTQSLGSLRTAAQQRRRASDARLTAAMANGTAALDAAGSAIAPGLEAAAAAGLDLGLGGDAAAGSLQLGMLGSATASLLLQDQLGLLADSTGGVPTLAATHSLLSTMQLQQHQLLVVMMQLQAAIRAHTRETDMTGSSPVDAGAFTQATAALAQQAAVLQQLQSSTMPLVAALLPTMSAHATVGGAALGGAPGVLPTDDDAAQGQLGADEDGGPQDGDAADADADADATDVAGAGAGSREHSPVSAGSADHGADLRDGTGAASQPAGSASGAALRARATQGLNLSVASPKEERDDGARGTDGDDGSPSSAVATAVAHNTSPVAAAHDASGGVGPLDLASAVQQQQARVKQAEASRASGARVVVGSAGALPELPEHAAEGAFKQPLLLGSHGLELTGLAPSASGTPDAARSPRGSGVQPLAGLALGSQLASQLTPQAQGMLQLLQAQVVQATVQAQAQPDGHDDVMAEVRINVPHSSKRPRRGSNAHASGATDGTESKRTSCTLDDLAAAAEALEPR